MSSPPSGGHELEVLWEPEPPRIRSARAWRKFQSAYLAARDEFLAEVMTMTGQTMAVVTPGAIRELAIIHPEVRH